MRIVRYMHEGRARYGTIEDERLYPCDGDPFTILKKQPGAVDLQSVKLLAPVSPPNIICLGLNYKKHADEAGLPYPPEPLGGTIVAYETYTTGDKDFSAQLTKIKNAGPQIVFLPSDRGKRHRC